MKGQSPIFEQVMLFSISIAIFIICLSIFHIYEVYFTDIMMEDQLTGVKDFITSNILTLSKKNENFSMKLEIPGRILNQIYEINLYNLTESFEFSGSILSSYGKHIIYKKGNKIIIE
jgi:hypothetical protein